MKYHKIINTIKNAIWQKCRLAFSNIAEGTHSGSITLKAAEDINDAHLLVSLDDSGEAVNICSASTMPIGVAVDECDINDNVAVVLAGSAKSSFLCKCNTNVNAGDVLYTSSGGKVSNQRQSGSYKVGVALTNASMGCIVEVDTQGFGTSAIQFTNAGIHIWNTSQTEETIDVENVSDGDIVVASFYNIGGTEKTISATASFGKVKFTLDTAGTPNATKISWATITNN